ncbi:MAG: hypothetical protein M3P32_07840 [Chloroflexota bacterium]|nr:hypothetical protein [Chloroflexota bacterium]
MSSNPEQTFDEAPSDFLRSLVDAMRRVVEATRDRTLAEMREAVETAAGQLDMARAAREAALRERAEAEITGVGSWERAEIERIRADALRKVQARGGQLDQELAELAASNTADHAALAARADAYEHEVSAFIEGLDGIQDPAAFAAAARNMPSPWAAKAPAAAAQRMPAATAPAATAHAATAPAAAAPADVPSGEPMVEAATETPKADAPAAEAPAADAPTVEASTPEPAAPAAEPVATEAVPVASGPEPGEHAEPQTMAAKPIAGPADVATPVSTSAERNGVASASDSSAADVVPAEPVAPEAVAPEPVADQATSIQVHGLGSFGAITSFKQSLERVDGIRSVTLGLGPSGEFVYTATHAPAFDLGSAIRAIEGEGVEIERDNGTLRVKVGKGTKAG